MLTRPATRRRNLIRIFAIAYAPFKYVSILPYQQEKSNTIQEGFTAKTQGKARNASGSIGRSAASPLTATAALRFVPCGLFIKKESRGVEQGLTNKPNFQASKLQNFRIPF